MLQIVVMMLRGPMAFALAAAHESDLKAMMRYEKLALAYSRQAGTLERRLAAYRRQRGAVVRGESEEAWEYDVAAMAAVWRVGLGLPAEDEAVAVSAAADGAVATSDVRPIRQMRREAERRARKLREQAVRREAMLQRIAARAERMATAG